MKQKSKQTRLTPTQTIIDAAESTGWKRKDRKGTFTFTCPNEREGMVLKPQQVKVESDGEHLVDGYVHSVTTTTNREADLRTYPLRGAAAAAVIVNTFHPFQTDTFIAAAEWASDNALCIPVGMSTVRLRNARIKGYMKEAHADELSVRILRMTPIDVWGTDEYLSVFYDKWE